jgi:hypothetical protein
MFSLLIVLTVFKPLHQTHIKQDTQARTKVVVIEEKAMAVAIVIGDEAIKVVVIEEEAING